mmetsp:Transcript_87105/g.244346  ORF Transcript_87105/g.244346 Transcript_87105/m.244346 type:complete len:293 (-) Transcript_87105:1209-2087(-)
MPFCCERRSQSPWSASTRDVLLLDFFEQLGPVTRPRARFLVVQLLKVGNARDAELLEVRCLAEVLRRFDRHGTPLPQSDFLLAPHNNRMPLVHCQAIFLIIVGQLSVVLLDCASVLRDTRQGLLADKVPSRLFAFHRQRRLAQGRLNLDVTHDAKCLPRTMAEEFVVLRCDVAIQQGRILHELLLEIHDVLLRGHDEAGGTHDDVRRGLAVGASGDGESVRVHEKPGLPTWKIRWQGQLNHGVLCAERKVAPLARHSKSMVQEVVRVRSDTIARGHRGLWCQRLAGAKHDGR